MSFNYQVLICALSGEKLNGENCHSTLGTAEKKTEILLYARLTKLGVLYGELGEPDRRYRSEDACATSIGRGQPMLLKRQGKARGLPTYI